jgi:hypothetical protein
VKKKKSSAKGAAAISETATPSERFTTASWLSRFVHEGLPHDNVSAPQPVAPPPSRSSLPTTFTNNNLDERRSSWLRVANLGKSSSRGLVGRTLGKESARGPRRHESPEPLPPTVTLAFRRAPPHVFPSRVPLGLCWRRPSPGGFLSSSLLLSGHWSCSIFTSR